MSTGGESSFEISPPSSRRCGGGGTEVSYSTYLPTHPPMHSRSFKPPSLPLANPLTHPPKTEPREGEERRRIRTIAARHFKAVLGRHDTTAQFQGNDQQVQFSHLPTHPPTLPKLCWGHDTTAQFQGYDQQVRPPSTHPPTHPPTYPRTYPRMYEDENSGRLIQTAFLFLFSSSSSFCSSQLATLSLFLSPLPLLLHHLFIHPPTRALAHPSSLHGTVPHLSLLFPPTHSKVEWEREIGGLAGLRREGG